MTGVVATAKFVRAAVRPSDWPEWTLPEVAFAGRSNVGKSSLLNALARRRALARVSSTPGRTREVHFYRVVVGRSEIAFVDLPGYGFAKASRAVTAEWPEAINRYLAERGNLRGVVVLVDVRRDPDSRDSDLVAALRAHGLPAIVVATKCDKLSKAVVAISTAALGRALGASVLPVSAARGDGLDRVWRFVLGAAEGR